MKRVPILHISKFDNNNIPVLNRILEQYGNSINDIYYGEMYQYNSGSVVTLSAAGTYTWVVGMSADECSGFTFQNSRELLCNGDGTYLVTWSVSFSGAVDESIEVTIGKNGSPEFGGSAHTTPSTAGKEASLAATALITLVKGDVISLLANNHDAANNIAVEHASFTIVKIDD